jgi:threonylcarbamoyladenosine tRNA methylthiotransferase MtaB
VRGEPGGQPPGLSGRKPAAGMRYHTQVPTYHVENFGCRATQADGAALDRQFEQRGLHHAAASQADFVILNTCTVTAAADQDARAAIRRLQRQNPKAKIVVTGCYAQRAPQEIAALAGVTAVIGNSHKHQLAALALLTSSATEQRPVADEQDIRREMKATETFIPLAALDGSRLPEARGLRPEARLFVSDIFAHTELLAAPVFDAATASYGGQRTRPNLKVQDGCDNRCSFCVIPSVRGQSRSLPLDQVLREVNALVAAGYRELVISGINLGRWGRDLHYGPQTSDLRHRQSRLWTQGSHAEAGTSIEARSPRSEARGQGFEDLIRAILNETSLEKLRISSVEPMDWTDELIRLVGESPRIARHAHVPLQSGSDAVLRRMHRKYHPWHYREKIEKIRAAMPTAAIGADVMVGFPGETQGEFDATRRFIEDLPFTYLHVFTYSARPGTPAANMLHQIPVHVARERNRILRDLAEEKKRKFMHSFIGQQVEAITLGSCGAGTFAREGSAPGPSTHFFTEALTDNYLKLQLNEQHAPNRWIKVEVTGIEADALIGEAI